MFVAGLIQGRWLGAEDFEVLQRLIAEHPEWSRRRLSIALCEALHWLTASGQLKDMSARLLLNKLAERGFIKLPPRRHGGGRQILRALSEPELFSLHAGAGELIQCPLGALQPLEVIPVQPSTAQANAFIYHLAQHHYLGFEGVAGQNLRYLLRDCYGRDLACVLFAGAAWKVKARDAFIGWSAPQRQERLSLIINNSRFLICLMCACRIWLAIFWALSCGGYVQTGSANTPSRRAWRKLLSSESVLPVFATRRPIGPYLYTEKEVQCLLVAAKRLSPSSGLRPWTYHCLFGLLAVSGLRISEAINLDRQDVDFNQGLLTIRQTKFNKSRLIPLHVSTRDVLAEYAQRRDRLVPTQSSPCFLLNDHGRCLESSNVRRTFCALSLQIGLRGALDHTGPRLHDFRHRFATNTLVQWYRSGQDPARRLPLLSTYLGHVHVSDTQWSLEGSSELMREAMQRLQQRWENRP